MVKAKHVLCMCVFISGVITTTAWAEPDTWDSRLDDHCDLYLEDVADTVATGDYYWRLVSAVFEDESESGFNHHIYYKCLDEDGDPIEDQTTWVSWWYTSETGSASQDTKGSLDGYWANAAMYANCPTGNCGWPYNAWIDTTDGDSDKVWGMGMHNPDGTPCGAHVNFRLIWQWTEKTGTTTTPTISLSTSTLSPSVQVGSDASSQTFTVSNSGTGTLSYAITDNQTWLSVSPASGTSTTEADTITVTYDTDSLSAGSYNATISVTDSGATNSPQTIAVSLTVTAADPTISLSTSTISPSVDEGSSPSASTFTVSNTGGGTLDYSVSDNVTWLSVSPASGTSTGEADTITVTYSTASLSAGSYSGTITVSDPDATNDSQTIAVSLTVNEVSTNAVDEGFTSLPSWDSTFDAGWGGQATWAVSSQGQSGNCMQISRTNGGSSAKVEVYSIVASTDYTISVYIACPSATNYWAECAYKLGSNSASNFDSDASTWTMIKKFDAWATNGNSNTWTQYSLEFNSGSSTQISVGFKLGSSDGNAPAVRYDTLVVGGDAPASEDPTIGLSTSTLSPTVTAGNDATAQTFTISNTGDGTLSYSVSDNATWMSVSPTSGTSTGEADTITVTYDTDTLTADTYNGTITVSDPNATNDSQTIAVTLTVNASGGSFEGLSNGDLEDGFYSDPDGDHKVADDWSKFVVSGSPKHAGYWHTENHTSGWAQNFYESSYVAGIYQQVTGCTSSSNYTAKVWVRGDSNITFYVGVDPTGGTSATSTNVQWSSGSSPSMTWTQISKQVQASGSTITVFIKASNPMAYNQYSYFDDAEVTTP